jgi:tetratricopeptide (TPR) repeat protein
LTVAEALALGVRHHEAGRLAQAEQVYRAILQKQPEHAEAWHLLGVLAEQAGSHDQAMACIGRAVQLRPGVPLFHTNLGTACRSAGQFDEAVAHYREALRLRPDDAVAHANLGAALVDLGKPVEALAAGGEALRLWSAGGRVPPPAAAAACHNTLGNAHRAAGRPQEAVAHYREAVRLQPDYALAHFNLGFTLVEQGRPAEAVGPCREVLRLYPDHAEAHNTLAAALVELSQLEPAAAHAREALRLRPDYAAACNNLGRAVQDQGRPEEAIAQYREALRLQPAFAVARNNLGTALMELQRLPEAVACFEECLRRNPEHADALTNLGAARLEQGRLDEALAHSREALRLNPDAPMACASLLGLAAQGHQPLSDAELERARALLASGRLAPQGAVALHFALGGLLDRQGAYDEAFDHYRQANELQLDVWRTRGRAFDPDARRALVEGIRAAFTAAFFERVRSFGPDGELPVFIVGMPRSGTTLVEQILSSHPGVFGAGELRDVSKIAARLQEALAPAGYPACVERLDRDTARALAEEHLRRLDELGGSAARVIDKMPENYLHLGLIAALFPRARVVHCRRDPVDVCLSCYFQNFQDVPYSSRLEDLGLCHRLYERLMAHWRDVLPLPVYEVRYEDLVANQEAISRELVAFCGLDWDDRCLAFHENRRAVRTASRLQVRRPIYSSSVRRWKHYEAHLQPLLAALGDAAPSTAG